MNGSKRLFSIILCCALLFTCLPVTGYASSETLLTIGNASGLRGETVQVTVDLNQADGIASGKFAITYDASRLILEDAVAGELLCDTSCFVNKSDSPNTVRVSFAGAQALPSGGTLLTLTFTIRNGAAFGASPLVASEVKLMDVNAETVTRSFANGTVSVLGAAASISSVAVMAGESTEVVLSVDAPVPSCGCEVTLKYDPSALTVGRITGAQKLGSTPILFSSSVDEGSGIIKISFISSVPIDGFGELCTIKITASADAAGDKVISFHKLKFVDENSYEIAHLTPKNAVIHIEERLATIPKLYFANGSIDSENGIMTVYAALNGASVICGVNTLIRYDPSVCTLLDISPVCSEVMCNPATAADAEGKIKLSWVSSTPSSSEQLLLKMTFQMSDASVSALTFSKTALKDVHGEAFTFFNAYNGKIYDSTQDAQLSLSSVNARLERDYAQSVPVTVSNLSTQSVHYYLQAENPYDDIFLNFVSCGSEMEPITILPNETQTIYMSVFTQNAEHENYSIPITAFVAYGDEYYANAVHSVDFSCHIPNVNVTFTRGSVEDSTLKTKWQIENTGETITDLTLSIEGNAKDYVAFESGYENFQFNAGSTISVKLVPDLWKMHSENVEKFTGKLIASGGGKEFSTDIAFNTNGRSIICLEAYRMALYQDGNPYYLLENTAYSSNFDDLTEDNCESFVADDGSFEICTESEYAYAEGEKASITVSLSCSPTISAVSEPLFSLPAAESDALTIQAVIGESDYIELLSGLFSDMSDVFDLEKQASEMAEEYLGIGNMEMKVVMKISDPILKEILKSGGDLGQNIQFFLNAAQAAQKALGGISDALDVASIWANPNITQEQKLAYAALGLAQAAAKSTSDPSGGWFSSGISTGFSLLNSMYRTYLGEGPLSQKSNEALGYYINTLVSGYQCTNAGSISSGATLTKGMCGFFAAAEIYRRLGDGTLNERNILQSLGSGYRVNKAYTPSPSKSKALFAASEENASLVWITGRMAAKDNSYVNQEATTFTLSVNGRYIGAVQNHGLTEMFCVGLITDAFVDGSNTVVRKYNTNPGSHYVTAETEYSILVPANSEVAYIGSMEDYSELRPLPDFAVYPENVYTDSASAKAIVGEQCNIHANVYNRGQRGGWVDIVFSCEDTELYRIENQYIDAFSSVPVSFPWIPDGTENEIQVSLINKTEGITERRDVNNAASIPVSTRVRDVPMIKHISPNEIVIDSISDTIYLTADVSRYSDIVSAGFSLDGITLSGMTSAQYGDFKRYTLKLDAAEIVLGQHELLFNVLYRDGSETKSLTEAAPLTVRYHDCDSDGHILLHHPAVKASFDKDGSTEYWYCDSCGFLFSDSEAAHKISIEDTLLEKMTFTAMMTNFSDTSVTIHIKLPNGLPQSSSVIVAVYDTSNRMSDVYICTKQDMSDAKTDKGSNIVLKRGRTVKVFLLNRTPLCNSIEIDT